MLLESQLSTTDLIVLKELISKLETQLERPGQGLELGALGLECGYTLGCEGKASTRREPFSKGPKLDSKKGIAPKLLVPKLHQYMVQWESSYSTA